MFLQTIAKVLYSPIKAFQEIIGNPKYKGPIVIIIISLLLTLGTHYVSASKHYVESITPPNRVAWTNMTDPSSLWSSNGQIVPNATIFRPPGELPTEVGNYSVHSVVENGTEIWLKTNKLEAMNCTGNSGFKKFYYKLWYRNLQPANFSEAKLRLFSSNDESKYFEFNLLNDEKYLNKSGWTEAEVQVGENAVGWVNIGGSDWAKITGIEFALSFTNNTKLLLRLNSPYFGGKYESYVSIKGLDVFLAGNLTDLIIDILLRWLILAGMLWLTIKAFQPQGSPFKTLIIFIGYIFVVSLVIEPINMLLVSQLSTIYFPFSVTYFLNPKLLSAKELNKAQTSIGKIYEDSWSSSPSYILLNILSIISAIWTITLIVIGAKTLQNFSWKKAILIGIVAYLMAFFLHTTIRILMAL